MTHLNFAMTTLLNGICQGVILAAAMWMVLRLLPRLNSTTRFTVLWLTLLAVAVLPIGLLSPRAPAREAQAKPLQTVASNGPEFPIPTVLRHSRAELRTPANLSRAGLSPSATPQSAADAQNPNSSRVQVFTAQCTSAVLAMFQHPLIQIRSVKVLTAIEILWAFLSFIMLIRLAGGYWALRSLKSGATPAPKDWQLQLRRLCASNGVGRHPRLLVSSAAAAPMSLGFLDPAIVIPQALLETLSHAEVEHIVLHELAHLRRRDDWSNLAQKLIEALLPIQPALYWIGHKLSLEREIACDDWVIAATGTAKPYAASLTKVAELSQWERAGILAAGAAGDRSQLFQRVHHMLHRTRNSAPKLAIGPLIAAVLAVVALTYLGVRSPQLIALAQNPTKEISTPPLTAPRTPQATRAPQAPTVRIAAATSPAPIAAQANTSPLAPTSPLSPNSPPSPMSPVAPLAPVASLQGDDAHVEMTTRNGWTSLSLKIDGKIEFTDDDHDVKTLSPRGHFRVEEGSWFSGRVYDVKADWAGNLTRTYSVGRTAKPLDDDGRAWLAHLLPQMIRDSGFGAGPRVARILRQGGVPAVIAEIGLIRSDGSRRIYVQQLFSQATLSVPQLKDVAKLVQGISSDGDKAQTLVDVDQKYFTGDLRSYLFDIVESINSDGDKRRAISDIVKKDPASTETLVRAARAARRISSDGDKAAVLVDMSDPYRASDELRMTYFEAVNSISSDGDHARVLSKLLDGHGDDHDTVARVLRSAQKISSDGDKARVLRDAVPRYTEDDSVRKAFFDAANSITSDGDHQQVLVDLAQRDGVGFPTLGSIANSAQRISSDGDKARVLVDLAAANLDPIRDAFFAAADSVHSDGDRGRVLIAVLDRPGTSSTVAVSVVQSAVGILSDGDKARVLLDAATRYSGDPNVIAALHRAVESLHSDGEYRAVMSEIARHNGSL
jgi:beta-lactamase regulating signal transducer with metallopeptidase domain